jgi:hypothetical protein
MEQKISMLPHLFENRNPDIFNISVILSSVIWLFLWSCLSLIDKETDVMTLNIIVLSLDLIGTIILRRCNISIYNPIPIMYRLLSIVWGIYLSIGIDYSTSVIALTYISINCLWFTVGIMTKIYKCGSKQESDVMIIPSFILAILFYLCFYNKRGYNNIENERNFPPIHVSEIPQSNGDVVLDMIENQDMKLWFLKSLERKQATRGETCTICLEEFVDEEVKILSCSHEYHVSCISDWILNYTFNCPICRQDFNQIKS